MFIHLHMSHLVLTSLSLAFMCLPWNFLHLSNFTNFTTHLLPLLSNNMYYNLLNYLSLSNLYSSVFHFALPYYMHYHYISALHIMLHYYIHYHLVHSNLMLALPMLPSLHHLDYLMSVHLVTDYHFLFMLMSSLYSYFMPYHLYYSPLSYMLLLHYCLYFITQMFMYNNILFLTASNMLTSSSSVLLPFIRSLTLYLIT